MKKPQTNGKTIRMTAAQLRPPTAADLERLDQAAAGRIDTSDIRAARIPLRPHSPIRRAISEEMRHRGLTGHRLWKLARQFCPRLPESAVYEFLAAKRSVRVEYADAMLLAMGLRLTAARRKRAG